MTPQEMNIQQPSAFGYADEHRLYGYPPQFWSPQTPSDQSQATVRPYGHDKKRDYDHLDDYDPHSRPASSSAQPTVIPHAPSPPSLSHTPPELYGPDRLYGPPLVAAAPPSKPPAVHYNAARPVVRFDEAQITMDAAANAGRVGQSLRDSTASAAGFVTPGVDDSQYIQFALDALTREGGAPYALSLPSMSNDALYEGNRMAHDPTVAYAPALAPLPYALTHPDADRGDDLRRSNGMPAERPVSTVRPWKLAAFNDRSPSLSSSDSSNRPKPTPKRIDDSAYREVTDDLLASSSPPLDPQRRIYPYLTYKPFILRIPSMILLITLCALMIAGLIFSAIHSKRNIGLTPYDDDIYKGRYFVFRILPQMLGAIILLYSQGVITTSFRILPFAMMASEAPRARRNAIFQDLYPKSFLYPHLVGPWQIKACIFVTWLMNFTLPLLSASFTVIYVEGQWIWAAVQGVVWTLVALYFIMIGAALCLGFFWARRKTGLMWDVRSIADIMPMINRSNTTADYAGTELAGSRKQLRNLLRNRTVDKLGYWNVRDPTMGIWYGIGVQGNQVNMPSHQAELLAGRKAKKERHSGSTFDSQPEYSHIRHRYLPWCMRNNQLVYFVVAGCVLLVALFVISFVSGTRLSRGFRPELSAQPGPDAFSPANFLYSFLPSFLGLVLFLLFQALDQSIRILHPWAELSNHHGAPARSSILLDYAACLPFEAAFRAAGHRHWRVAFISFIAGLFVFLPILAGSLFMALTIASSGEVRMFPNIPVFGVLLGLLVLFLAGLVAMLPNRKDYRLPHAVTCLAEIISFCANNDFTSEPAFRFPRTRENMINSLNAGKSDRDVPLWYFGHAPGRDERLGVRRLRRFTDRGPRGSVYVEKKAPWEAPGVPAGRYRREAQPARYEEGPPRDAPAVVRAWSAREQDLSVDFPEARRQGGAPAAASPGRSQWGSQTDSVRGSQRGTSRTRERRYHERRAPRPIV